MQHADLAVGPRDTEIDRRERFVAQRRFAAGEEFLAILGMDERRQMVGRMVGWPVREAPDLEEFFRPLASAGHEITVETADSRDPLGARKILLAATQCHLRALALGDVLNDAEKPRRPAVGRKIGAVFVVDDTLLAIWPDDPEFGARQRLAGQDRDAAGDEIVAVLRM